MASPLTLQADSPLQYAVHRPQPLEAGPAAVRLPRRRHRKERGRTDPFPFDPVTRWLLRLVIALPYAGIAALLTLSGETVPTGNALLLDRVNSIDLGGLNVAGLLELYPPISTALAVLVPGGLLGMGLVGALVAGVVVQKMIEIAVQRQLPRITAVVFVLALAANPLFAYLAVGNLGVFLGLSFFGLGLTHVVRFILWGSTRSGFIAGLLFMVAALCDGGAIFYVLSIALAAPFLRWSRGSQRGAHRASVAVLLFPIASAFILLVALELLFRVDPFGGIRELVAGTPGRRAAEHRRCAPHRPSGRRLADRSGRAEARRDRRLDAGLRVRPHRFRARSDPGDGRRLDVHADDAARDRPHPDVGSPLHPVGRPHCGGRPDRRRLGYRGEPRSAHRLDGRHRRRRYAPLQLT